MSETRFSPPNWRIRHLAHDGQVLQDYFNPENLTFTLNKGENGPHEVAYEISRSRDFVQPGFIGNDTNFQLWRGDLLVIAGMVTSFTINSNEEHVNVSGKSWLHYLSRRFWPFTSSDPNAFRFGPGLSAAPNDIPPAGYSYAVTEIEVMQVVRDLLNVIQLDDNCLDYTYLLSNIGVTLPSYTVGLPDTEDILSKITALSQQEPGEFDFWMTNGKQFQAAFPRQYDTDVYNDEDLAEHTFNNYMRESGLIEVDFTNSGPQYTALLGQGSSTSPTATSTRQYIPGSEQFYRLDGYLSYPTVTGTTRVEKLTQKKLLFGLNPIHEITIQVAPERINNFWSRFAPGKAIWVKADLGGWRLDSAQEIVTMECSPTLEGNEVVTMKLNQIYNPQASLDE